MRIAISSELFHRPVRNRPRFDIHSWMVESSNQSSRSKQSWRRPKQSWSNEKAEALTAATIRWKPKTTSHFPKQFKVMFFELTFMYITCEGGERKPARVFSVKPARKMISNIDYPIISHLSNMPTFFWAKTRQIRGADTPRGRNVPGKEAGQRQTKWHTVWCAISICHTWPRR